MKILNTIGELYTPEAKKILSILGEVDFLSLSQTELEEKIGDYDGVVIGLGLHFSASVLQKGTELKFIATATTGLDHIDIARAKEQGIEVLSLRGEEEFLNTITATAELALGLMLDLSRGISEAFASVKQHEWKREQFRGHSLTGKTLGIVGLGRLGKMMAQYGQGLGMNVIACDPFIEAKIFQATGVVSVDFSELLSHSDVISLHVHLTPETENMFNTEVFKKMKPTACLINTARGKIVNEVDVLQALEQKIIAGYATDVLDGEVSFGEQFDTHPLVEYAQKNQNIIITPHIGGMTHESREATDIFIAQKVVKWASEHI